MRALSRRPSVDIDVEAMAATTSGGQEERMNVRDFCRAFRRLSAEQQRALLLVGLDGRSYEEAAEIADCAVGTMKSRVSRARLQLQQLLEGTGAKLALLPLAAMTKPAVQDERPRRRRHIETKAAALTH
jgi:DNA-directed RNA polymerase specialized sigma24 family protein